MAINRKEVFRTDTFEDQRVKINEVAQDLFDISTGQESIDRLLVDGSIQPGAIIDSTGSTGEDGQFLKVNKEGKLLWKSLTIENVLFVSKDGDDTNDGLSQETAKASIGAALRTAQRGYFGKLCDGANNILLNKKLIQDEVVGELLTEYKDYARGSRWVNAYDTIIANKDFIAEEGYDRAQQISAFVPPGDGRQGCIDDVKLFIDAVAFNVKYDGNQKVYDFAEVYTRPEYGDLIDGERDDSINVYQQVAYTMMQVMRQDPAIAVAGTEPPNLVGAHGLEPVFDNSITLDPLGLAGDTYERKNAFAESGRLIQINKEYIAKKAYNELTFFAGGSFSPVAPGTKEDCLDDVLDVLDAIIYNLQHGGNDKVVEAATLYEQDVIDSQNRTETLFVFEKVRDISIEVINNREFSLLQTAADDETGNLGFDTTGLDQITDPYTLADGAPADCVEVESALAAFQSILAEGIGTDGNPGTVTTVSTPPDPATQYGYGCTDVASAIWSLTLIYLQAIGTDATPGNLDGITRTSNNRFVFPDSPPESGRWKDARNLIFSNMEEIQDRSLAEISIEHPDFFFPGSNQEDRFSRYRDSYRLIQQNRREIVDRALAEIANQHEDFSYPGDPVETEYSRYKDAYRLVQQNRTLIVELAYDDMILEGLATVGTPEQCKRDIGFFVDSISLDMFLGGANTYTRKFLLGYYNDSNEFILNGLEGEEAASIVAFQNVEAIMEAVITNQLSVTLPTTRSYTLDDGTNTAGEAFDRGLVLYRDLTVLPGESEYGDGLGDVPNTDPTACADVRSTLNTLVTAVVDVLNAEIAVANSGFTVIPDEFNVPQGTYQDASNLVFANKNEIADRGLAQIAIDYPDFVFPGDPASNQENYRYYDGYRLIQQNKNDIDDETYNGTAAYVTANPALFPNFHAGAGVAANLAAVEAKCRRDISYFTDAVSLDVFTRGNRYTRDFTLFHFDEYGIRLPQLDDEEQLASQFAWNRAAELMKLAVSNQLAFTDPTVVEGPAEFGSGEPDVSRTDVNACSDVQTTIDNLATIVIDVFASDDIDLLPYVNNGDYNAGMDKCKRDLGYVIDAVVDDLYNEANVKSIANALAYFPGGVYSDIGEEAESVTAFNAAANAMELAVTNQLFRQDLSILADPATGDNKDPASCAAVRATIQTLVGITSDAINTAITDPALALTNINAIDVNYGNPLFNESKCGRDIGFFVDAISLDIFLGAGNRYTRKLAQNYFISPDVPLYTGLLGEEAESITAFNMARDMMQKAVTNQLFEKDLTISPGEPVYGDGNPDEPVLESGNAAACIDVQNSIASLTTIVTDVIAGGNLSSLPVETQYQQDRFDDAAGLIGLNKNEILDKSLAQIAIDFPDFNFNGDEVTTENSRYADSYRLIQQNKASIVDDAFTAATLNPLYSAFDFLAVETKCKRDLGYFIDAISLDVFTRGNRYIRYFTNFYFDEEGNPITNGVLGEESESVFTFRVASELMKAAITNQDSLDISTAVTSGSVYVTADLTGYVKDLTVTPDPATQSNTDPRSCADVRTTIDNLTAISSDAFLTGTNENVPPLNEGIFLDTDSADTPGGKICRRDLGLIVDAVMTDLKNRSNTSIIAATRTYIVTGSNILIPQISGEVPQTVSALGQAIVVMQDAIQNVLYKRDLTITDDGNVYPNKCIDVQNEIASLVTIVTDTLQNAQPETFLDGITVDNGEPSVSENKCRRDISYVVRAIAEDLYANSNVNTIQVARRYFDNNGDALANGIVGEEAESITAYKAAARYIKKALTNQLFAKDLELFRGPEEYGLSFEPRDYTKSGTDKVCIDVQFAVDNLFAILEKVITDGTLEHLNTVTENYGRKGWKKTESLCFRDTGYVVVGIATDLKVGGNVNTTDIANFYFDNDNGRLIYIDGELEQSILAYRFARDIMKKASNQWIVSPSNDLYEPKYSLEPLYFDNEVIRDFEYPYCTDVDAAIDNYWNIIEFMLLEGGKDSVQVQLPSFKTTVFVKSGVYTEQTPIVLPPNTGIFGDNLRDVSIYPSDPTQNLIYCENGGYITNVTFSGHLFPSYTCSFPKTKIGETFTRTGTGVKGSYQITLDDLPGKPGSATQGLKPRMYVTVKNIPEGSLTGGVATAAVIISIQDKVITLSTANELDFNNIELNFDYYIGNAGNITRSPYVQNCTSLTTTGSGLIVDGNLAEGTASFVLDSYTQYNQGGDGITIVNGGYTQLVSIFEICCNRAVYLTAGSTCSITNSNTDFGNFGLVADGVSPLQYTAFVDGNQNPGSTINLRDCPKKPYIGQGITIGNNGNPYFFIQEINITNGGSGYASPPSVVIDDPTGPSGIPAQAIANLTNGVVTSITLVSSGSQFITPPNIVLVGGSPTVTATVQPEMYPQYYSIVTGEIPDPVNGKTTITTDENIAFDLNDGDEVFFFQQTRIIANSHCMEYVGAGTKIQEAIPARGGVPIQANEVVELNGGKVAFTSTDQLGNFRIGQGLQINQNTGTLSGDSFQRSLFVTVTPFILALS